jgi:hypothetical protein
MHDDVKTTAIIAAQRGTTTTAANRRLLNWLSLTTMGQNVKARAKKSKMNTEIMTTGYPNVGSFRRSR